MHLNSLLLFQKHALERFQPNMRVLEIGPDAHPSTFRRATKVAPIAWETIDLFPAPGLTHRAINEYSFPLDTGAYDIVLAGQVIEHVRRVWEWIPELARVCKPGGYVITINPVNWPYHEAPIDCWRMYPEALRALHEEAGLQTVLATVGALEPLAHRLRYNAWQLARRIARGHSAFLATPSDAIAIGRKPEQGSSPA
jgi:SAM-dependent methyltransferase